MPLVVRFPDVKQFPNLGIFPAASFLKASTTANKVSLTKA